MGNVASTELTSPHEEAKDCKILSNIFVSRQIPTLKSPWIRIGAWSRLIALVKKFTDEDYDFYIDKPIITSWVNCSDDTASEVVKAFARKNLDKYVFRIITTLHLVSFCLNKIF